MSILLQYILLYCKKLPIVDIKTMCDLLNLGPHLCFVFEQAGEVGGHGEDDDEDAGGQGEAGGEAQLGPGQQEEG